MRSKKILALAIAGATMLGSFGAAIPAMAADATTTVTLKIADTTPEATYELTVPSSVTVANAGYNALGSGIMVKNLQNGDSVEKVTVSASSTNSWALKSGDNSIAYKLVAKDGDSEATTSFEFAKADIASETGKTISCGINVSDYSDAAAGDYTDTITWTASVTKSETQTVTLADALVEGAEWKITYHEDDGMTIGVLICKTGANQAFTISSCKLYGSDEEASKDENGYDDDNDLKVEYVNNAISFEDGVIKIVFATVENTYTVVQLDDYTVDFAKFEVKPANASDFVDITSTLTQASD